MQAKLKSGAAQRRRQSGRYRCAHDVACLFSVTNATIKRCFGPGIVAGIVWDLLFIVCGIFGVRGGNGSGIGIGIDMGHRG